MSCYKPFTLERHDFFYRQTSRIGQLAIENKNSKTENQQLLNIMVRQNTSIQDIMLSQDTLTSQVAQIQHIETGTLHCGGSTHWTGRISRAAGPNHRYTDVTHKFSSPYTRPPHLQYAVVDLYFYEERPGDRKYTIYWVYQTSLTELGFTLRCEIEDLTTFYSGQITIRWSTFPK